MHCPGHAPIYIDVTIVSAVCQEALSSGSGNRDGVMTENRREEK